MKKHVYISLLLIAIALSTGVCYSATHKSNSCKSVTVKESKKCFESNIAKKEFAIKFVKHDAILCYAIEIEPQTQFVDGYVLRGTNSKSLQYKADYTWLGYSKSRQE